MTKPTKSPPRSRKIPRQGPGLQIDVAWQFDGGVYQLSLTSIRRIQKAFPEAAIIGDMLIGYAQTKDYERFHRRHWEQIAQMLTGLTPEQIAQMGGVRIHDPGADKELWVWKPHASNGE